MPYYHYLLTENKNEVDLDRTEIHQDEAEQMSNSSNWFIKEYGKAAPVTLLMIHPSPDLADSAYPPAGMVVMTQKGIRGTPCPLAGVCCGSFGKGFPKPGP